MGKEAWERQRLKDLYSHMSDGELEEIALDWANLTAVARKEIQEEVQRRNLVINVEEPLPDPVHPDPPELVTVAVFPSVGEAVIVKNLLESSGIGCSLIDRFYNRVADDMASLIGLPVIGDIQLQVKVEDAEAAKEFFDQPVPPNPDEEE